jgi:hypothetical protein
MNKKMTFKITKGFLVTFFCCAVWMLSLLLTGSKSADITGLMLVFLYGIGIWGVVRTNAGRVYPFAIFLLYCFVSNAGQTITHLLGIETLVEVSIYKEYSSALINRMLLLQCVFVLCMLLGYLLVRKAQSQYQAEQPLLAQPEPIKVGVDELSLWVLSLYVGVIYAHELSQRVYMDYGEYYYETRQGVGTVAQYLYHVVIFAYLFKHTGWKRRMAFGIILVLSIMAVFIGSRSATIPVIVGVCFILSYQAKNKFKLRVQHVVWGIVILLVFSAFADLREYPISELSLSMILETVTLNPIKALAKILQEMGTSARTTLTTMMALDKNVIRHEGTILYSLLKGVFPLSLLNLVGVEAPNMESLSAWVSNYGSGLYVEGKGWGYSFIGEVIYNYGNWGFVFCFIFGILIAWLENSIEKLLKNKDYYLSAGILYVLGYSVFLARAETTLVSTRIRYTVYMAVLIVLIRALLKKRSVRIK